jgi:hypothetical protein
MLLCVYQVFFLRVKPRLPDALQSFRQLDFVAKNAIPKAVGHTSQPDGKQKGLEGLGVVHLEMEAS